MSLLWNILACSLVIALAKPCLTSIPCAPRDYGRGSIVCVCNSSYCDQKEKLEPRDPNLVTVFESNKDGLRFQVSTLPVSKRADDVIADRDDEAFRVKLEIDSTRTYQEIIGFGGAFTDAAGININSLTSDLSAKIIENYYSDNGLEYTVGRVPIGGTDFSTRAYSLDDVEGDFQLANFSLAKEDYEFKLPLIKMAKLKSSQGIKLFASAWSAPAWMKTNNDAIGLGWLIGKAGGRYYKLWAKYYVKFLEAYEANGITFWGLTTGNEPTNGFKPNFAFNCMGWKPEWMRDFLKLDLGPALSEAGYGRDKLKIMVYDDNRNYLPHWADVILRDPSAAQYVAGTAVHWYNNASHHLLSSLHHLHPNYFILATEACEGWAFGETQHVILGSWERAETYTVDIMKDLQNWATGWVDWNLALDEQGGPNWVENYVDSPIIVNATANEFYKQPMFYALGHFSKFLPPGSRRVEVKASITCPVSFENCSDSVLSVAFQAPDGSTVVIFLNLSSHKLTLNVYDSASGNQYDKSISPRSILSFRN
ncbi:Lysosomal acid glucosylceramidase [Halotydeus destructor]|nr:Lysosomal acid glucosylceramidase [Halotydeus destructor]